MLFMINYKFGEVVLVPFPFTDLTTTKNRPAIVVSSDWYNAEKKDVILSAITSQITSPIPRDEYPLTPIDLQLSGLLKTSTIKIGKIVTIDKRLIRQRLGKISDESLDIVEKKLINLFGKGA